MCEWLAGWGILLGALLLAAGCATTPEQVPPAPTAPERFQAGPTFDLLRARTVRERVAAVADVHGRVHLLVATTATREVWHLVVDAQGVQERHLLRRDASPDTVDAAFDREGRLHALVDDEPWVFDGTAWHTETAPWLDAGLKALSARFVPGAPDLVWAFHVDGSAIGSPTRVDWWGMGGYGGALIWPWPATGRRVVIVARSAPGTGPWLAMEPQGKSDTRLVSTGADRRGDVYALYEKPARGNLFSSGSECDFRGLRIGAEDLQAQRTGAAPAARAVTAVTGLPVMQLEPRGNCADGVHAVAVDPDDGSVWYAQRRLLQGDRWRATAPMPLSQGWTRGTSAGGAGRFHVLRMGRAGDEWLGRHFPVYYLHWSITGGWAAPLQVGVADVDSFWGMVSDSLAIVATGPDRAFIVWPTPEAIVGRWVEQQP